MVNPLYWLVASTTWVIRRCPRPGSIRTFWLQTPRWSPLRCVKMNWTLKSGKKSSKHRSKPHSASVEQRSICLHHLGAEFSNVWKTKVPAEEATSLQFHVRISKDDLIKVLQLSGTKGIYTTAAKSEKSVMTIRLSGCLRCPWLIYKSPLLPIPITEESFAAWKGGYENH